MVALVDIPEHGVKKGDVGGWVKSRRTLAQDGNCWVGGEAMVVESAKVVGDALVAGNALLRGRQSERCELARMQKIWSRASIC